MVSARLEKSRRLNLYCTEPARVDGYSCSHLGSGLSRTMYSLDHGHLNTEHSKKK